jgi:curved DNA-binding protein CbpA
VTPPEPGRESIVPKPKTGVDVRALPLTPMEGFVLSRVDGRATASEIALATGMAAPDVIAILQKLDGLGAVQYGRPSTGNDSTPGAAAHNVSSVPRKDSAPGPGVSAAPARITKVSYDPSELAEPADLDPERKHRILETFHRLETISAYELLGVARDAEKKAIKSAYYDIVGLFHPDKYFGKNLGSYKPKLEKIFQRVTEAHDTLTRATSRADYDLYLQSQEETRAFEAPAPTSIVEIHQEIEREARLSDPAQRHSDSPLENAPSSAPAAAPSGGPGAPTWSESPRPLLSAEERRRALARKLRVSMPPVAKPVHVIETPSGGPSAKEMAGDALRRRYEARLAQARDERVRRYVKQAEEALAANSFIAATNALRIAVSLSPEDIPLADQLDRVERQASAAFADRYLEQARYDERRGHLAEAAHTYEKVLRGRPSAYVYERAAHCLVESGGDLKKANDLARKAVELSPNETAYRITLARIYAKAGMEASATSELERARTLDPSDDTVKDWLKRLKRGEI